MLRQIVFLTLVIGTLGGGFNNRPGFGNSGFGNSGFGNSGFGNTGFQIGSNFDKSRIQVQKKPEGSDAGARNADAESIHTADHQAGEIKMNKFACVMQCNTNEIGPGSNAASGINPKIQGAAQAGANDAQQTQGAKFSNQNHRGFN